MEHHHHPMKQIRCTVARILLALSILAVRPGQAGSVVWTNILGGDWSGAANWNPNGGPGSSDTAVLPDVGRSYTVNLDVDATVSGLVVGTNSGVHTQTFTNGLQTLTINGVVEVNSRGVFNLNGGTITGTYGLAGAMTCSLGGYLEGTLTVSNNGVINLAGAYEGDYVALDGTTLTNYGTVNWLNTGNTILYGGSDIPGVNGTVIWNYGLWNAPSDNTFYGSGFLGGTAFNNFGTFLNTGTNTLDANVLFTNTGTLIAQSGTLSLNTCDLTGGTLDFGIQQPDQLRSHQPGGQPRLDRHPQRQLDRQLPPDGQQFLPGAHFLLSLLGRVHQCQPPAGGDLADDLQPCECDDPSAQFGGGVEPRGQPAEHHPFLAHQ